MTARADLPRKPPYVPSRSRPYDCANVMRHSGTVATVCAKDTASLIVNRIVRPYHAETCASGLFAGANRTQF
jgi:hypothetical protein